MHSRILVLGLGNDLLTDDAIGLHVARDIGRRLAGNEKVDVRESAEMGLALLDLIVGYRALVLVDSIQTRNAQPGFVHEIDDANLKLLPGGAPHLLGVGETLALGRQLGMTMPQSVTIFAVEVEDALTLATQMTPALRAAFPGIVERVLTAVERLLDERPGRFPDRRN